MMFEEDTLNSFESVGKATFITVPSNTPIMIAANTAITARYWRGIPMFNRFFIADKGKQ
jgi:hypothetical protein